MLQVDDVVLPNQLTTQPEQENDQNERESVGNSESEESVEMWPGPYITARSIIADRKKAEKVRQEIKAKKEALEKRGVSSKPKLLRHQREIPSLKMLSIKVCKKSPLLTKSNPVDLI